VAASSTVLSAMRGVGTTSAPQITLRVEASVASRVSVFAGGVPKSDAVAVSAAVSGHDEVRNVLALPSGC
jgi:hypothetical protein